MQVVLVMFRQDGERRSFSITRDVTVIGRREYCDVQIDHPSLSKRHCVLVKTDGLLLLRDLGSTNGTRVNGTRVRRAALLPNDKVSFANFHFRIHLGPLDQPAGPNEHTQAIDAQEVHQLLLDQGPPPKVDSAIDEARHIQVNVLPDVYPEEAKKK